VPGALRKATAPDGGEAPVYNTWAEIPESAYHAEIWNEHARVNWRADTAVSYARMSYIGNRASMTFNLTILHKYTTVATPNPLTIRSPAYLLTEERGMGAPFRFHVSERCGQVANLNVYYTATSVLFIQSQFTELSADDASVDTSARQADCTCTSTGGTSVDYDPSDPGYDPSDPNGDGCGDDSGGTPSGTQFEPGQSTGGETVTWSGGVGNGGRSACGSLAVVEYVCIDVWDEERGWVEWDCGYVTTC
jgi:hypothetical protein